MQIMSCENPVNMSKIPCCKSTNILANYRVLPSTPDYLKPSMIHNIERFQHPQ